MGTAVGLYAAYALKDYDATVEDFYSHLLTLSEEEADRNELERLRLLIVMATEFADAAELTDRFGWIFQHTAVNVSYCNISDVTSSGAASYAAQTIFVDTSFSQTMVTNISSESFVKNSLVARTTASAFGIHMAGGTHYFFSTAVSHMRCSSLAGLAAGSFLHATTNTRVHLVNVDITRAQAIGDSKNGGFALGGAMHLKSSVLTMSNTSISYSRASNLGGGLFLQNAYVTMSNATRLFANHASNGSSLYSASGSVLYQLPAPAGYWSALPSLGYALAPLLCPRANTYVTCSTDDSCVCSCRCAMPSATARMLARRTHQPTQKSWVCAYATSMQPDSRYFDAH